MVRSIASFTLKNLGKRSGFGECRFVSACPILDNILGKDRAEVNSTEIRRLALLFADAVAHRADMDSERGNSQRANASDQLTGEKTVVLQVTRGADNSSQKATQRGQQFDPPGLLSTAPTTLEAYGRYRLSPPSRRKFGSVLYVRLEICMKSPSLPSEAHHRNADPLFRKVSNPDLETASRNRALSRKTRDRLQGHPAW
jgi:hypothetical protein